MNKARRKKLGKAISLVEDALDIVAAARDDEQDYIDNLPENLQQSEKGEAAQEAEDNLNSAHDSLEEARDSLENAAQ